MSLRGRADREGKRIRILLRRSKKRALEGQGSGRQKLTIYDKEF